MVGNNSAGSTSIKYGSTRDHVQAISAVLSDGSLASFRSLTAAEFETLCQGELLENRIYEILAQLLSREENRRKIISSFPKPEIHRRNMGYALDELAKCAPFDAQGSALNVSHLLAGSEGTLALFADITLNLCPLPPPEAALLCAQFSTLLEALRAVPVVLEHDVSAVELVDRPILDCTKKSVVYQACRFFLEGSPGALLIIEVRQHNKEALDSILNSLLEGFRVAKLGYTHPIVRGDDIEKVWQLRKAGFGLLNNVPGDVKSVTVVEDTAVAVVDLSSYIAEFDELFAAHGLSADHSGHAGAGELHMRPLLNLKDLDHLRLFRRIAEESAALVSRYDGSLSGEHGDGRLRGEFLPQMVGDEVYAMLCQLKRVWDPKGIFNPGKIVEARPMDEDLRYEPGKPTPSYATTLDFSESQGIVRMAERCNGSADCRRSALSGGTMCPSYMATRNERDTTRARANVLREYLTRTEREEPFSHPEMKEVLDLCLSCKGCKAECPAQVDVALLKAEVLHQFHRISGIPLRDRLFAGMSSAIGVMSAVPWFYNTLVGNPWVAKQLKWVCGIAEKREFPRIAQPTLRQWYSAHRAELVPTPPIKGRVLLFADEFTSFFEPQVGIAALRLLSALGYEVDLPRHPESGRAAISKGMLKRAKRAAERNVQLFSGLASTEQPLIGLEPSALLGFRDEFPRLVPSTLRPQAEALSTHTLLIDEFLSQQTDRGNIDPSMFTDARREILLHGHCHQKALSSVYHSTRLLRLPAHYSVTVIPSGCCGMAGSFGYEKEHFALSMEIGELVLFPAVREASSDTLIAAPGFSCREQIRFGTGRNARHPVELLWEAHR